MGFFAKTSGLDRLADKYAIKQQPEGSYFSKQTIQIGAVRYRKCVTIGLCPSGLYLWPRPIFSKNPAILVPWPDIVNTQPAKIYQNRATELTIGEPRIGAVRVYVDIYRKMEPFLKTGDSDHGA